jgi:hypothetical protein
MSDPRPSVKLDFMSGLEKLPPKPRMDAAVTLASVAAGREFGFSSRQDTSPNTKMDGRRLRSRGANTQLNLKVTASEKEAILHEAIQHIQNPSSPISNIGEFVVMAVNHYRECGGK